MLVISDKETDIGRERSSKKSDSFSIVNRFFSQSSPRKLQCDFSKSVSINKLTQYF